MTQHELYRYVPNYLARQISGVEAAGPWVDLGEWREGDLPFPIRRLVDWMAAFSSGRQDCCSSEYTYAVKAVLNLMCQGNLRLFLAAAAAYEKGVHS